MTELDRRVEELATVQLGAFSSGQVLLLKGTSKQVRNRVRSGRWIRGHHGVLRLVGAPDDDRSRWMGFVIASGFRAVVSHRAAARLHGLPGFEHAEDEFTMPTGVDVGRNRSLELHHTNRLPAAQVVRVDSLPVTCVARTLLDLTAVVSLGRSARAMDTALAQKRVTYWELVSLLAAVTARGRRRTQVFRLLLEERGPHYRPPESELERRFDRLVVRSGLSGWIRQVDLGDTQSWIGRVDFYHRRDRIVVELDGKVAHSSFMDTKSDRERDRRLTAAGFLVLRFGWAQVVHDAPTVIAAINATKATP